MKNKSSTEYKMEEPPDPGGGNPSTSSLPYYKGVKHSLASIVKRPATQKAILDAVHMAHKINVHILLFLKMYLLQHYDNGMPLPKVDDKLIVSIMKVICEESVRVNDGEQPKKTQGRKPNAETVAKKDKIREFYNAHYASTITPEPLSYKYLNTLFDYSATSIVTMYENNIKQHFVDHVERFVNVMMRKKEMLETMTTTEENYAYIAMLRRIKKSILQNQYPRCGALLPHIPHILPQRPFQKDSIYYDLCCSPQDYLPCMIYMAKRIEAQDKTIAKVFPIRTDIIPKYVRIDTTTLVHLCINKDNRKVFGTKDDLLHHGNLVREKDNIWGFFFRTELRCFNYPKKERKPYDVPRKPRASLREKHFQFDCQIETDGEAVTILLVRKDMAGKRFKPKLFPEQEKYIDDIDPEILKDKKVVAIDPNMGDLIHCSTLNEQGERIGFRYTQDQRRKETKMKKYAKIQESVKAETVIEGKKVKEWEAELSLHNSKTVDFERYKAYVTKKNQVNSILMTFYQQRLFRKLKWYGLINRKRSERLMLQRFLNTFGSPEEVVIAFGDWEQKKHMKFKEPTKGKGIRTLFRKFGYLVYLVDEFRTSCKCYNCKAEPKDVGRCEKFRWCENPRPWKAGEQTLRHGLVKCTTCACLWNRDELSSLNIHAIGLSAKYGLPRPSYMCRGTTATA